MSRPVRAPRQVAWLVPLLAGATACGDNAPVDATPDERPAQQDTLDVPLPRLSDVDPDVVRAIEAARSEVVEQPDVASTWGRLGNRYLVHDFLAEARECFQRAEELDPERIVWTYRQGLCLIDEDPAEAARYFELSLRDLSEHAPAHEHLAHVLFRLGRLDEALDHYRIASDLDPDVPDGFAGLGQVYLARGELEAAREALETALERNPRFPAAHVGLAQVYLGLDQADRAREHAEAARMLPNESRRHDLYGNPSVEPAGARARTQFGRQLERRGEHEKALEQYRIAVESNPDFYAARWNMASLLTKLGRKEEGLALLREGQERNPALDQIRRDLERLERRAEGSAEPAND